MTYKGDSRHQGTKVIDVDRLVCDIHSVLDAFDRSLRRRERVAVPFEASNLHQGSERAHTSTNDYGIDAFPLWSRSLVS